MMDNKAMGGTLAAGGMRFWREGRPLRVSFAPNFSPSFVVRIKNALIFGEIPAKFLGIGCCSVGVCHGEVQASL